MDTFVGYVYTNGSNFAPRDYSFCSGQILAISQNTTLFSLIGSQFGGDGRSTMGLPDLRARTPIGSSIMGYPLPPLSAVGWGQKGGAQFIYLSEAQLPKHKHNAQFTVTSEPTLSGTLTASIDPGQRSTPEANDYLGATKDGLNTGGQIYTSSASQTVELKSVFAQGTGINGTVNVVNAGNSSEINIMNPYVGVSYVIAMTGSYPSRN